MLNGSPKRDQSDTMHITRAFLAGMAEGAEIETEVIHVIDRHIEFCRGCLASRRCCCALWLSARRMSATSMWGRQYAEKGEIDAALLAQIGTPMIPENMYARIANGE